MQIDERYATLPVSRPPASAEKTVVPVPYLLYIGLRMTDCKIAASCNGKPILTRIRLQGGLGGAC